MTSALTLLRAATLTDVGLLTSGGERADEPSVGSGDGELAASATYETSGAVAGCRD